METDEHMDAHKFVSSSAADRQLQQLADVGVAENLPRSDQLIFAGEKHIADKTENLLFDSVHKGRNVPSGSDINEFILHESRANVLTDKNIGKDSGQVVQESENVEPNDAESWQQIPSQINDGKDLPSASTEENKLDSTLEENKMTGDKSIVKKEGLEGKQVNFDINDEVLEGKEDSFGKNEKSTIHSKIENDSTSQLEKTELWVDDKLKGLNKNNLQTNQRRSTETGAGDAEEIDHRGHSQSTEVSKTDIEDPSQNVPHKTKESLEFKTDDHLSGGRLTETVEQKDAAVDDTTVKGGSYKDQLDPVVCSERTAGQTRTESGGTSGEEEHKEFISHESGVQNSDDRKQKNNIQDRQDQLIHSEQVASVAEANENESLETVDILQPKEQQDDSNQIIGNEQQEEEKNDTNQNISDEQQTSKDDTEEDWLDILGSGQLKKKIIRKAENDYRPQNSHICEINLEGRLEDGRIVEKFENLKIQVGDVEVVQGIDLVLPLMNVGEVALLEIGPRFAYGSLGRSPDIPADAKLMYTIELLSAENEPELELLSIADRKKIGYKKRERGNWWYARQEYSFAIQNYRRAIEFLDDTDSGFSVEKDEVSEDTEKQLQDLLEDRLKVFNNLAAAQMKIKAYDAALTSVENVLRCQPQNVKALFRKGKILAAKGDTSGALSILRNASELEPDSKVIKQEMQRLMDVIKHDTKQERNLYKKMLGQNDDAEKPSPKESKISYRTWGILWSSVVAVILGVAVYRSKFL